MTDSKIVSATQSIPPASEALRGAEPGAPVGAGVVPLSVPEIRGMEWTYVQECLDSGWVSSVGTFVERFEREFAAGVGTRFGVATVNGTAALHVALILAGVEANDEVLVSALTFIAPVNAIRYLNAWPVFIDAEPDYWQIDPAKVVEFLTTNCVWRDGHLFNRATGRRVKAILPVHILGHPVDMDPIVQIARRLELRVIEDATESVGAHYRGRLVGDLGDVACFSFNGNKLLTTGGGGMIVTNRADWAERAMYLTTQAKDDPIEFVHNTVGYNYRLTNVQAALGCAQLELLGDFLVAKRRIASRYEQAIAEIPGLRVMPEAPWARSTRWLYTVLVDQPEYGCDSRALMHRLRAARIQARPLWQPGHRSPAHRDAGVFSCPVADRLNRDALSIPCSVGLTEADQQRVIEVLQMRGEGAANS